jgi:hypothetical protein
MSDFIGQPEKGIGGNAGSISLPGILFVGGETG